MKRLNTYGILKTYIKDVFPMVDNELSRWKRKAMICPDNALSIQAVSSICKKSFHARGGSVFAIYPGVDTESMVKLIVTYQTISDYLDNLCDRAGVEDEKAFYYLHLAMIDALNPWSPIHDYYMYYPYKNDGGYLKSMVEECRIRVSTLPSYYMVKEDVLEFAELYSCLQIYKHLSLETRELKLFSWAESYNNKYPYILPQEFCAASGSTLGIFMLLALSSSPNINRDEVIKIKNAYFPWVCGLHILLDYFIDINEDIENNDLNFIRYYENSEEVKKRLSLFLSNSMKLVSGLSFSIFHTTMVLGLLAMYLSDNKAYDDETIMTAKFLLSKSGARLRIMHGLCRKLRKKNII